MVTIFVVHKRASVNHCFEKSFFLNNLHSNRIISTSSYCFADLTKTTLANDSIEFVYIVNVFDLLKVLEILHIGSVSQSTSLE